MSDEREGIEQLREAIEEVAREIESQPRAARPPRPVLPWALAAAVAVVALLAWLSWPRPVRDPEVEVLVLKVRGRPVEARVVEGEAPSTIIILPARQSSTSTPLATTVVAGGAP
jgi:hypothetical protein